MADAEQTRPVEPDIGLKVKILEQRVERLEFEHGTKIELLERNLKDFTWVLGELLKHLGLDQKTFSPPWADEKGTGGGDGKQSQ